MIRNAWLAATASLIAMAGCDSSNGSNTETTSSAGATAGTAGGSSAAGVSSGGASDPAHADNGGVPNDQTHGGAGAGQSGLDPGAVGGAGAGAGAEAGAAAGRTEAGAAGVANGSAGGAADAAPAVAYVSTFLGDLLVASLDPTSGTPTLLPSSPIAVDGFSHGVAVSPNGKFLFVPAAPARIDTYPIGADGTLPPQPSGSAPVDDDNPMLSMALDPLGRFAYGVSPFSQTIYVFTIEPTSGALTLSGPPLLIGTPPNHRAPAFVAPDPTGRFVYVTQLAAGPSPDDGIRAYRVDPTSGALAELPDSPFSAGNVTAGAIVFRPDGKFLFTSGGGVSAFAVDGESGKLELVEGSPFSLDVQSDPWAPNLSVDPSGKLLYASNFLQTNHITGFAIDPLSGALEQVPGTPVTTHAPYSIALGPGGRFLYVGDDTGEISVFHVEYPSGLLTPLEASPFQFGGLEADFAFVSLP